MDLGVDVKTLAATSASSSSSSSSSSSRIFRDGEEYPEEEVYTEPDKKVKMTDGDAAISDEAVNEIELALAQEEVMSMNVSGCLLDEEESNKR